jgi:uncharacterized protein
MKPTILTHSGHYFNLLEPHPSMFNIHDIGHALSHICRYTGHVNTFYSVAQHSVAVSKLVPPEHALAGLLHDAAEAYIGDVSSPLKHLLPEYKAIEARIEAALFKKFGLPPELPECVKHADKVMLATEQRDLMPPHDDVWPIIKQIKPLPARVWPLDPGMACALFLLEFRKLVAA